MRAVSSRMALRSLGVLLMLIPQASLRPAASASLRLRPLRADAENLERDLDASGALESQFRRKGIAFLERLRQTHEHEMIPAGFQPDRALGRHGDAIGDRTHP